MNKANWACFKEIISNLGEEIMQASSTDNADTELLRQMFKGEIEQGIKDSHPWIDRDLDRKIKQRDRAFTQSNKTGREKDEKRFQQLKHEVQRDERRAYWSYVENLITPKEEDHEYSGFKRFYKFIKHKKTDFNGVAPLKVDGKLVTEPKDKAEALNHQFQSVFSHETVMPTDNESSHQQVPSMPSINITARGVLKLLKGLNPNKASGPDNISPRILRELSDELASPLTTIFQHSLQQGVAPVFKKGQKYLCSNYRPVSLTCIISKLMEHIINSSIIAHARSHNILYHQEAFPGKMVFENIRKKSGLGIISLQYFVLFGQRHVYIKYFFRSIPYGTNLL